MRKKMMENKAICCLSTINQFIHCYSRDKSRDENAKKPLQSVFVTAAALTQELTYEADLISQ